MKTKIILFFYAMIAVLGLVGCASMGSTNTKSLLVAAGFREVIPATAKQTELYAAAPAYKVQRINDGGKIFYGYKDEKAGTALVGNESNYQQYEKLAIQQRIAQQEYQAAEMRRDAAYGWYGAYGAGVYGPVRYGAIRR